MISKKDEIHIIAQQRSRKNSINGTEQFKSTIFSTVQFYSSPGSDYCSQRSNIDSCSLRKDARLQTVSKKQTFDSMQKQPNKQTNEQVFIVIGDNQHSIDYSNIENFRASFQKMIKKEAWVSKTAQKALKVKVLSVISEENFSFVPLLKLNLEEYGKQKLHSIYQPKPKTARNIKEENILQKQKLLSEYLIVDLDQDELTRKPNSVNSRNSANTIQIQQHKKSCDI